MGNDLSPADALFSATQKRVLGALFGQPGRSFYATELIALCGGGSGAVQRELARLVGSELVTTRRIGTQKHYQANPDAALYPELCSIAAKGLAPNPPENAASHVAAFVAANPAAADAGAPALHEPAAPYVAGARTKLHLHPARIAQLCAKYGIRKLSLFGSAARNQLRGDSDVDLLVEFDPDAAPSLLDDARMKDDFSELFDGRTVDLASPEILRNPFRRRAIEPDLRLIYEAR